MKHLTMTELIALEIKAERVLSDLYKVELSMGFDITKKEQSIYQAKDALLAIRKEISSRDGQPFENPFSTNIQSKRSGSNDR